MKYLLLNITCLLIYFFALGQSSADSLLVELPHLEETEKAKALVQLAHSYAQQDSSRSIQFADEAISLSKSLEDSLLLGLALFNKAECYYYFDVYEPALNLYGEAQSIFMALNDSVNLGETLNSIGLVHYFRGEYNLAGERFYRALSFFKGTDNIEGVAHVNSNLAMVFSRLGEYEKAIRNYQEAANLNSSIHDRSSLAVNLNGVGVAYYNLEEYDSSKVYYNKALLLFRALENHQREAIALNNIANIYVNTGDSLELALGYYRDAIGVFDELHDRRSKAYALEGLASVERELGNYNRAIATFQSSLDLLEGEEKDFYLMQLNYMDMALTYERMGDVRKAYNAFKQHSFFKDSLLQQEQLQQIAELEKKYETQQKEAEIEQLNASREMDRLQMKRDKELRAFGIIAILLLVVAIFLVSLAYFNKRRTNALLSFKNGKIEEQRKELVRLNASKNKFFSIIAHDLKNPFHTVMGYSYLLTKEYDRFSDDEKQKYATDIYRSANSIFRLLQNLLDWSRSQTGRLTYTPQELNFHSIYKSIENLLKPSADQKQIQLIAEVPDEVGVFADPMMLETILRNLMHNAIKFTDEAGWVKTTVDTTQDKITVCVQDSGVGIPAEELNNLFRIDSKVRKPGTKKEDGSGLGLIICHEFVTKNGGSIWADSQNGQGSRFYFSIPRSS
ncbi:tetratricopeptide repeat protein [Sunxiuqinia elliptica]